MRLVEEKIFRVFLDDGDEIKQAEKELEDIGYRIVEKKEVDKTGILSVWEIKVIVPWGKII